MIKYIEIDNIGRSIGSIYITGGGFVNREFKGASPDSAFGWSELVWKTSPSRGANFAFTNIDTIDIGLVARCEINIKYMSYEDYIDMRKILKQRRFLVTFFDADDVKWYTRDMYCSGNSKNKFLILDKSLIGTINFSLKFVGTNLDLVELINENDDEVYSISNKTATIIENGSQTAQLTTEYGGVIKLPTSTTESAPSGQHFNGWQTKNGNITTGWYGAGQVITLWNDLTLYPLFEQS